MILRLVLGTLISLAPFAALPADELPPPKVEGEQPTRSERRERLRRLGSQLVDALVPPTGNSSALDVDALNRVLGDLLAPLATTQGSLESIELKLMPEATDLAADKAALGAAVRLRQSVWSNEPSRLACTLAGRVEKSLDGVPVACIDGQATLETEVLPLANFAIARARDRLAMVVERTTADESSTFAQLAYNKLNRTGPITTLDELADVLIHLAGLQLQVINAEIESLHAALSEVREQPQRRVLSQRLQEARQRRDRLFEVRPRIERNEAGTAQTITIALSGSRVGAGLQIDQIELVISEHSIGLQATLRLAEGVEWYLALKPLVLTTLARLQSGDAALLNSARALRDEWQRRLQELLSSPP